jgi:hypothetical protein
MAKRKRKATKQIVPPLGPAKNLRPAGAHEDETKYDRTREKAALRREDESRFDSEDSA